MSIIREFYEGEMRPNEIDFKNHKYKLAAAQYEQLSEKLKKTFSPKQKKLFESLNDRHYITEYEYGREMYTAGFAMGVKLTAESFCTKLIESRRRLRRRHNRIWRRQRRRQMRKRSQRRCDRFLAVIRIPAVPLFRQSSVF